MSKRTREGFTLVEMLVVISIIGVLVSITLPAINAAREAANRASCMNNQRNLAMAVDVYVSDKGHYPSSLSPQRGDPNPKVTNGSQPWPASPWLVPLLTYLDQAQLVEGMFELPAPYLLTDLENNPMPYIGDFVCPSDSREKQSSFTNSSGVQVTVSVPQLSYVVNAGRADQYNGINGNSANPIDLAANGIFHDTWIKRPGRTLRKIIPFGPTDVHDGLTTTILLSENLDAGLWTDAFNEYGNAILWTGKLDVKPFYDFIDGSVSPSRPLFFNEEIIRTSLTPSPAPSSAAQVLAYGNRHARPSSMHPNGVVFAMCDGSTMFISEEINYLIYARMMTPHGHETEIYTSVDSPSSPTVNEWQEKIISGEDLDL